MKQLRTSAVLLILTLLAAFCLSAAAMADLYFPKALREIGDGAFEGVSMQKTFVVPSGTERIGARAFAKTGVQQVWLPKTLRFIAPDAFDEGTEFICSPYTYAEEWCQKNGVDYDFIKPTLKIDEENLAYGETATLTADCVYNNEPTSYVWERRERERSWSVIPGETGAVLRYTNTEEVGFNYFRVSAVWEDVQSVPSVPEAVTRYGREIKFYAEDCEALSGDSIYLEWNKMGKDAEYNLYRWDADAQKPQGGEWTWFNSVTDKTSCAVYGLDKNTAYRFRVALEKDGKDVVISEPITITTGEKETSFQMREFAIRGTSVHLAWEPIYNAVYDVYLGADKDNPPLFASGIKDTQYHIYNFTVGETAYVRLRARIQNTGYSFWGPILEIKIVEEGPSVKIESCEVQGDILHLQWTALPGCVYAVYGTPESGKELCFETETEKSFADLSGFNPGEKWSFRVKASCGRWSAVSPDKAVSFPESLDDVQYRALLIGQVTFDGSMYAPRNYGSVERMAEMLDHVKTPSGTHYSYIRRQDLNKQQILDAIEEAFGGADDNDVSLFYIATHGDVDHVGRWAGSLCTVENPIEYGEMLMEELAEALGKIKGTKLVWISACGSGAGVYDKDHPEEENISRPYDGEIDEEEWGDEWIEYEIDGGLHAGESLNFEIGELRRSDFQVLTAARHRFVGWGNVKVNSSFFAYFLTQGVYGPDGSMPADLNEDGKLTQHELFTYIKLREEDPETGSDQDVQAYPMDSDYVLFVK